VRIQERILSFFFLLAKLYWTVVFYCETKGNIKKKEQHELRIQADAKAGAGET
jgi:hypothetical protein